MQNRVLVVDDESEITEMISDYLSSVGFQVKAASDLHQAKSILSAEAFSLLIVDIFLGPNRMGGVELAESLKDSKTPVVLISGNASVESLKRALNAGAKYFFEKPFDMKELEKVCTEVIRNNDLFAMKFDALVCDKDLTPREIEIFKLLCKGLSNKDIATTIETSERTVKAHISSVFKKCNVSSRAELLSLLID